jgi:hypothetical protein
MKKILIGLGTVVCAVSVFAQGQIAFNTRVLGTLVVPVYGLQVGNPLEGLQGQSPAGVPAGTVAYTGPLLSGTGYSAQLFGGALGTADDALRPMSPATTFRTQAALLGFVVTPATAATLDGVAVGSSARIQMRAWDNRGGTVTSWDQVLLDPSIPRGYSLAFDSAPLGGGPTPPPNLIGLTSFNLFQVPEPSVIALGVLGVGALLLFRRRKN